MSKRTKKQTNVFSLSFLDCICCGFGAIILLFVISMGVKSREEQKLKLVLERSIQQMHRMLNDYSTQVEVIDQLLAIEIEKAEKLKKEEEELDKIIAKLEEQFNDKEFAKDKLLTELEEMESEMVVMQEDIEIEQDVIEPTPVGIPVESNHIAFVIDTSGSMRDSSTGLIWSYVVQKFKETLDSYPEVKGIQLLDADGHFIMGRSMRSRWMEDTPETRQYMVRSVRLYPYESDSNPVPGIVRAIRLLGEPDNEEMKMGIYVFGDEFAGKSDRVLGPLEKLNRNADDEVVARINAIGFPNMINQALSLGQTGLKFANLMRELTYAHDGAFVALEREQLKEFDAEQRRNNPYPVPRRPSGPSIIFGP
ncbi:MAG: hypothetical protein AAGB46_19155 [Verrucomicrobiota bacterium]